MEIVLEDTNMSLCSPKECEVNVNPHAYSLQISAFQIPIEGSNKMYNEGEDPTPLYP